MAFWTGRRRMLIVALMGAALVGSAALRAEPPGTPQALNEGLRQWVAGGFPSLSAAIATSCGVVWTGTAGEADVTTHRPASASDLYGIGSITKTFVAVVVLQLVEEGKLRLEETPARILGPAVTRGIANAKTATLAELMNHTSGIPSWEDAPRWIHDARGDSYNPKRRWSTVDGLSYIRGLSPLAAPGSLYHYSNTDYTLLGLIVEKVTGQPLMVEIRRRILKPLGLRDIYFEGYEPMPEERVPRRYQFATAQFRQTAGVSKLFPEIRPGFIDVSASRLSAEWAAGGMMATAKDLARFAQGLRDGKLLKPESLSFMMQWAPTDYPGMQVGHGLFRTLSREGLHQIGHTGGALGFTAEVEWLEETDLIFVRLANGGVIDAGKVPLRPDASRAFFHAALPFAKEHGASSCHPVK
jgi:D-alanyl-D-alanine carboxypeptidase